MSNGMKIFLIIICLSVTIFFVYDKVSNKIKINKLEKHILEEFGSLNDLKIEEIENTTIEQLKEQRNVEYKLRDFLKDDYLNEKGKIAKTLLSKFYTIRKEWCEKSEKIVLKYDSIRKEMVRKLNTKKRYELYLRKMKSITDENIIKQRLEKYEKEDRLPEEDDDKESWDKFFKLYEEEIDAIRDQTNEKEMDAISEQAYKKAKEELGAISK